ncbi:MAG: sulfite exporter TauE/SafE family protein [Methanomassiliicoccales archaeon]|nr:sulfite exporter TauE/SafE family protein [Methanomassiliicoccales archaeon]
MGTVLLVAIVLVFLIAMVFSMFGQGGGSVYTPTLFLLGYAVLISTSTSLVLNLITSVSAGYIFYRNKMIDFKTSMIFVPGICIGALIGGAMGNFVDTTVLLWLFVIFLIGVGARMFYTYWEKGKPEGECPTGFTPAMYALITVFGFAVGILSGLLGVGGGILVVPFMVYVCKYPTKFAAGSSHLIISFSALFGIIGHSAYGSLNLPLILVTGVAVLIGGNLGARTSMRFKSGAMKAGLGLIMLALAAQLILKLLGYM